MSGFRTVAAATPLVFVAFALLVGWAGLDAPATMRARKFRRRLMWECGALGIWCSGWAAFAVAVGMWSLATLYAVAALSFAVTAAVWSRAGAR